MAKHDFTNLTWREYVWQRPFTIERVHELFAHMAALTPRGAVVLESRSHGGHVKHLIGADEGYIHKLEDLLKTHGDIKVFPIDSHLRTPVNLARALSISHPGMSLNTDVTASTIRAALAAVANVKEQEETVVQVVLGASYKPKNTPKNLPDPNTSWLHAILRGVDEASVETRKSIKEKNEQHSFDACIRFGASGIYTSANARLNSVLSAFRTLESAGVRLKLLSDKPVNLNLAKVPWSFPLRLSIKELTSFTLLPFGEEELPGTNGLHPKTTTLPNWYREPTNQMNDRTFATTKDMFENKKLSISPQDSLEHTILLGPTGSGKSTAMQSLILSDIYAGRSVLVIDPKAGLVTDILERIPDSRKKDVVVIDPSDPCPVGFNPLSLPGDPTLIADSILAVFKEVFAENWGIRSQDILSAAFLTLIETEGSSLLWLPALLTDKDFRDNITSKVKDKIILKPFWDNYNSMTERERKTEIAPVLNKMRQFLVRPGLRHVLGQSKPKFQLTDLFYERKIVLVPLNKGLVGAESAKLLGSLIVGLTWTLALSRAKIPAEKRHIVSLYIDELQDYLSLPTDLSDALAQARGLGVGITMAHQFRAQLPPELREGVDANARNKIIFGLSSTDAKFVAAMAPELDALDFMTLPRYDVYANFMSGRRATGWIRGTTIPPMKSLHPAADIKALSQTAYGIPAEQIDEEFLNLLNTTGEEAPPDIGDTAFGRRKI